VIGRLLGHTQLGAPSATPTWSTRRCGRGWTR